MHDTHTTKVLTEADAAADLAGLPRPVSTDQSAQGVSTEHTDGRMTWRTRSDGSLIYAIGDHKTGPHAQGDIFIGEADLRRLAACWNACDGIADPENFIGRLRVLNEKVPTAEADLATLVSERDALASRVRELEGERDAARVRVWMPLLGTPFAVRMDSLNEQQAQRNHGQSLTRLAERGGLGMNEASAIAEHRKWREQPVAEAAAAIAALTTTSGDSHG